MAYRDADGFGHWLAGFIDGEGSFSIQGPDRGVRQRSGYVCRFELGLRADDTSILEAIQGALDIGAVYGHTTGRSGCHVRRWYVASKADTAVLVDYLDRYPLRSKKARDYALWREAVLLWQGCHRGFDWTRIAEIRTALMNSRAYAAVTS